MPFDGGGIECREVRRIKLPTGAKTVGQELPVRRPGQRGAARAAYSELSSGPFGQVTLGIDHPFRAAARVRIRWGY